MDSNTLLLIVVDGGLFLFFLYALWYISRLGKKEPPSIRADRPVVTPVSPVEMRATAQETVEVEEPVPEPVTAFEEEVMEIKEETMTTLEEEVTDPAYDEVEEPEPEPEVPKVEEKAVERTDYVEDRTLTRGDIVSGSKTEDVIWDTPAGRDWMTLRDLRRAKREVAVLVAVAVAVAVFP